MKEMRNPYEILVSKLQGKSQLETCKRGWEDNIKTDVEKGREIMVASSGGQL
jgi:hypothetical protein